VAAELPLRQLIEAERNPKGAAASGALFVWRSFRVGSAPRFLASAGQYKDIAGIFLFAVRQDSLEEFHLTGASIKV
jgi:hypothetical protein